MIEIVLFFVFDVVLYLLMVVMFFGDVCDGVFVFDVVVCVVLCVEDDVWDVYYDVLFVWFVVDGCDGVCNVFWCVMYVGFNIGVWL